MHQAASGKFIGNKIYQNTKSGVWITGQATPIFRENFIFQGLSNGICIHTGGQGLIENNDIYENTAANVVIREQASNPVIRGNRIRNGCAEGVHVHNHGRGIIADNQICANTLAGVFVTTDGKPEISNNRIFDGKQVCRRISDLNNTYHASFLKISRKFEISEFQDFLNLEV